MKRLTLALFAFAILAPTAAVADNEMGNSLVTIDSKLLEAMPTRQLGIEWFFQDATTLVPGSANNFDGAVIGLGLDYQQRFSSSSNWFFHLGGGYGIGGEKYEVGGTSPFTDKVSVKSFFGRGGFGYTLPLTSKASIYTRGGLFYSSTKGTFDDGTTEQDAEPFKVFGVDKSLGGRLQFNPSTSVYGELYSQFGWGSGEDGDQKVTRTVKYGCFRGGVSFGF